MAVCPYFRQSPRLLHKRIVCRHLTIAGQAQNFAGMGIQPLRQLPFTAVADAEKYMLLIKGNAAAEMLTAGGG